MHADPWPEPLLAGARRKVHGRARPSGSVPATPAVEAQTILLPAGCTRYVVVVLGKRKSSFRGIPLKGTSQTSSSCVLSASRFNITKDRPPGSHSACQNFVPCFHTVRSEFMRSDGTRRTS